MIAFLRLPEPYSTRMRQSAVPKPWVAHITGTDSHFGLAREFVPFVRDYSDANRKGNGIIRQYTLKHGQMYEVMSFASAYKKGKRYFVRVDDAGDIVELEQADVDAMLRRFSEETS